MDASARQDIVTNVTNFPSANVLTVLLHREYNHNLMSNVLDQNPHWLTSERDARAVRIALYRHLPETMTNKPEVVEHIMSVVRREMR